MAAWPAVVVLGEPGMFSGLTRLEGADGQDSVIAGLVALLRLRMAVYLARPWLR